MQQVPPAGLRVDRPLDDHYIRLALWSQFLLALYFEVISWIPLGRWNYQPCCAAAFDLLSQGKLEVLEVFYLLAFVLPVLSFWYGVRRGNKWLMLAAVISYSAWLMLQINSWWVPYVTGASESWKEVYRREFSASPQVLPSWGDHLPPDGMHLTLQILLIVVVCSGFVALNRAWKRGHA